MIGHFTDQAQIVCDEKHGHAAPLAQFGKQQQNLTLNCHIQSCGGFIGNQQFGLTGQRHGNHHALLLATRQLMRISIDAFLGLGYAYFF